MADGGIAGSSLHGLQGTGVGTPCKSCFNPGSRFNPKDLAIEGLLRSEEMISVFNPLCAQVRARLIRQVVLPSPGPELEINNTLPRLSPVIFRFA